MEKKGLTLNGLTATNTIFGLIALLMIGTSLYLTQHFYEIMYPTELGGASSLCDISSFWNCDVATYSPMSNFAGIPISFFGLVVGMLFLAAALFTSEKNEATASAVAKVNALGCALLFCYSLVALGGLCPMCTFYYLLSWAAAALFWKFGHNTWTPDVKVAGLWAILLVLGGVGFNRYTASKKETQQNVSDQIVKQFQGLANYGDPESESPYKVHQATEHKTVADSPLRMTIFSDFQCPFCQRVSQQLPQLIRQFGKDLTIQYMFYPLDVACNPNVKRAMHTYACSAAMVAACDPAKFAKVHDELFENQEQLNDETIKKIALANDLGKCYEEKSTRDTVVNLINQANKYNIHSTPTLIINGRKIEGSVTNPQFQAIFNHLLTQK